MNQIAVHAIDPGFVSTNFAGNNGMIPRIKFNIYYFMKRKLISPQKAAETIIYLASAKELSETTGKYFFSNKEIKSSPASYGKEAALKLWQLSLKLTGIDDLQI